MEKLMEFVKEGGRKVVVLRGVSGAGKSTLAEAMLNASPGPADVVSADHYFTGKDGVYRFDPSMLGAAHAACLKAFVRMLQTDVAWNPADPMEKTNSLIVVDNTNTTVAEAAPYMALAAAYGFKALLVTLDVPVFIAAPRNVHGVSTENVDGQGWRMRQDNDRMPPFWAHLKVTT
jgi:ABC-type dipeptide/oligopeptide/nickel transport system ATPase component